MNIKTQKPFKTKPDRINVTNIYYLYIPRNPIDSNQVHSQLTVKHLKDIISMGRKGNRHNIDHKHDRDNKCSCCEGQGFVWNDTKEVYITCNVCTGKGYIVF